MTEKINNAFIRNIVGQKPEKVREFRDATLRGFLVRQQPSGFISYFAVTSKGSARRGGRRNRKVRIGEHPAIGPTEARKAAEKIIAKARLDDLPLEKEVERLTLRRFLDDHYWPWAIHHLKAPASQRGMLRRFKDVENLFLDEIDRYLIEGWRNKRLVAKNKNATVNRLVGVLRSVLSKAVERGFLKQHPLAGLKKLSVDCGQGPRVLSDEGRSKLFEALASRDKKLADERLSANQWRRERCYPLLPEFMYYGDHLTPIVMTAYHTGMRRGEIFSMTWNDVDFEGQIITTRKLIRQRKASFSKNSASNADSAEPIRVTVKPFGTHPRGKCAVNAMAESKDNGAKVAIGWLVNPHDNKKNQTMINVHMWNINQDGEHYDLTNIASASGCEYL